MPCASLVGSEGLCDKSSPVDGALNGNAVIEIFQSDEYKEISQPTTDCLDPVGHGPEEHKGGFRPLSNVSSQSENQQQVTVTTVDHALVEGLVNNITAIIHEMSGLCTSSN